MYLTWSLYTMNTNILTVKINDTIMAHYIETTQLQVINSNL